MRERGRVQIIREVAYILDTRVDDSRQLPGERTDFRLPVPLAPKLLQAQLSGIHFLRTSLVQSDRHCAALILANGRKTLGELTDPGVRVTQLRDVRGQSLLGVVQIG